MNTKANRNKKQKRQLGGNKLFRRKIKIKLS